MGRIADCDLPGGPVRLEFPVYFVRHGQTDWNAQRRFQGHTDIALNETGRAQAARNGDKLWSILRKPSAFSYFASPLSRARETLEIIRERLFLPRQGYQADRRLIEIDLGDWNGKTPAEINAEDPGVFERREEDKWRFVVPGGESYADAAARTRAFLTTLAGPSIIAGHGASGRILRAYLRALPTSQIAALQAPQDVVHKLNRGRETKI